MKYLLDKSSFKHNIDSVWEWAYRIKNLNANIDTNSLIKGEDFLSLVHSDRHIRKVKRACEIKSSVAEIKLSPESFDACCNAVGLSIIASQQNDFAIIRPPWHHAFREQISWFCLFNNVAIATQKLVNEWKKGCNNWYR